MTWTDTPTRLARAAGLSNSVVTLHSIAVKSATGYSYRSRIDHIDHISITQAQNDAFVYKGPSLTVLEDMARRLEEVRSAEGLSQEAFSQRLGISRGAYQHYSKGGREIPSSVLDALLREFEIDPYWLLRGDDEKGGTRKERQLVSNAAKVTLTLREAYQKRGIDWDNDKIITAVNFACFYLFNKREPLADDDLEVIRNFAET